jgi:hypothetical protein
LLDSANLMTEPVRRFPAPWRADKTPGGFVVRGTNGQAIAHVYARVDAAEARQAKVLTKDEARRIATNMARPPELLGKAEPDQEAKQCRTIRTRPSVTGR